jgi:hypothetical protein
VDAIAQRQPAAERLQRFGLHALTVPHPASGVNFWDTVSH